MLIKIVQNGIESDWFQLTKKAHRELIQKKPEAVIVHIENTASTITEWSENAIRQIVECVTVLSADEVLVQIKGGTEIRQRLEEK